MNIILLGAGGFIGTNLMLRLAGNKENNITIIDRHKQPFLMKYAMKYKNLSIIETDINETTDFDKIIKNQNMVYHLISSTFPATSNQSIEKELTANVVMTARLLDSCVKCGIQKIIFISSGGTVYGKEVHCPIKEETPTKPISSYGIQKVTIEKLLYLYGYIHGLDYRIIRLANPYGPFQKPNGGLGAVTSFIYKTIRKEEIIVYGDGSIIRDFIFIDDAVTAILNIAQGEALHRTFNVGSGVGISIKRVLETVEETLHIPLEVVYLPGRKVDVPINYLDISRYEEAYGKLNPISLKEGIIKTAAYMKQNYVL